jgi:hypothetical protein
MPETAMLTLSDRNDDRDHSRQLLCKNFDSSVRGRAMIWSGWADRPLGASWGVGGERD